MPFQISCRVSLRPALDLFQISYRSRHNSWCPSVCHTLRGDKKTMNTLRRASSLYTHLFEPLTHFNSKMKSLAISLIVILALAGAQNAKAQDDDPINLDVPGTGLETVSATSSDQKPGSVLIYPVYTSLAS